MGTWEILTILFSAITFIPVILFFIVKLIKVIWTSDDEG